jgi:hypothetical protein
MSRGRKGSSKESVDSILASISRHDEIDPETMARYLDRLDEKWLEGAREKVLDLLRISGPETQAIAARILTELATNFDLEVLEDFVTDPTIGDMAKLSLSPILRDLGSEMADDGILEYLNDPAYSFRQMQLRLLEVVGQSEMEAETVLKDVVELSAEQRSSFAQWLGESGDPRAIHLLIPLLEHQSGKIVTEVIDAMGQLGSVSADYSIPALQYFSATTSNREQKKHAREVQERISKQAMLSVDEALQIEAGRYQLPTHGALASSLDGTGTQLVMLSWLRPDGLVKGVSVLMQEEVGMKDCYGIDEVGADDWNLLISGIHEQGFRNFAVPFEYARALVLAARAVTKRTRGKLPIGYAVWRPFIEGPQPVKRTMPPYPTILEPIPLNPEVQALAQHGNELYQLTEFQSWMYEPIESMEPYVTRNLEAHDANESRFRRRRRQKAKQQSQLEALIDEAIDALVDAKWQLLCEARLRRQAALFQIVGREKDVALLRAVAALLHPDAGVPAREQPFVRSLINFTIEQGPMQLMLASLENSGELTKFGDFGDFSPPDLLA